MTTWSPRRPARDLDPSTIRAVLFDVDGTLYRQTPLRVLMASEVALEGLRSRSLGAARRLARILAAFRRVREELRALGEPAGLLLDQLQFTRTADRTGVDVAEIRSVVDEWVMQRPLKHLRPLVRSGLTPLLDALAARRLRLGVLSDYPAEYKLRAMQLETGDRRNGQDGGRDEGLGSVHAAQCREAPARRQVRPGIVLRSRFHPETTLVDHAGEREALAPVVLADDRGHQVESAPAGGLGEAAQAEDQQRVAQHARSRDHLAPGHRRPGVEVDHDAVGPLHVVYAAVPGVELDGVT